MASKIFPAILAAVVIWLGAQLWSDSGEGLRKATETGGRSETKKPKLTPPSARPRAQDITLPSIQGGTVQLASFRGKSPVLVEFFATWCPGCNQELPHVIELYNKHREAGLEVFVISDERPELLRQFVSETKVPVTVLSDPKREAHDAYGVSGIPFTVLVDREGRIATVMPGYSSSMFFEELVPAVEQVLKGG